MNDLIGLDGLINEEIGRLLYESARSIPEDQAIVELGSYRGMSTCYLAAGARDGSKARVYAVDAWSEDVSEWRSAVLSTLPSPEYTDFERQLRKYRLWSRVTPVRGRTVEAGQTYAGPPVGLLYIDADHHHSAVLADFNAWQPHLVDGAYVLFDDYRTRTNPGVERAVSELCEHRGVLGDLVMAAGRVAVARYTP